MFQILPFYIQFPISLLIYHDENWKYKLIPTLTDTKIQVLVQIDLPMEELSFDY